MSKISDELREHGNGYFEQRNGDCEWLYDIADRIDNEMVELPKDVDGVPIHVKDTVYGCSSGMKMSVYELRMRGDGWIISTNAGFATDTSIFTHTRPDSWESIADELDEWCDGADADTTTFDVPRDLADRIRKLAKEQTND